MPNGTNTPELLDTPPVPIQAKLAAAWTSFMCLFLYMDVLGIYKPGVVENILKGIVWELDITETWAISALLLLAIPIFMILLSMTLPARANRVTNLIVASIQVPFAASNVAGELNKPWMYYYLLGLALELIVLAFILRSAWTWPRRAATPAAVVTEPDGGLRSAPQQA